MEYAVVIRPEAEKDLREAFLWYEDKRKGLGHDFLLSKRSFGQVEAGIRFIERNPEIYRAEYKQTRKCLLKRFPYKIICVIEENKAIVLAVLHGKRSPRVMKERIGRVR